jgi:hypothetical protein
LPSPFQPHKIHSLWVDPSPPAQPRRPHLVAATTSSSSYQQPQQQQHNPYLAHSTATTTRRTYGGTMASTRMYGHISLGIRLLVLVSFCAPSSLVSPHIFPTDQLLVIVAMILIMTAPYVDQLFVLFPFPTLVAPFSGVCFWRTINGSQQSREICPPSNTLFPMNIDRWNSALHFQMRGQK